MTAAGSATAGGAETVEPETQRRLIRLRDRAMRRRSDRAWNRAKSSRSRSVAELATFTNRRETFGFSRRPMFMIERRSLVLTMILLALAASLGAQSRGDQRGRSSPGTGNPDEHLVPWTFLPKGADLVKGPVVVYWLPASLDEMKRSKLLSSRALLEDSARCVGLEIVTPDDAVTIEKLGATRKVPMALIIDRGGRVIRQVDNTRAVLRPRSVEQMVSEELNARDDEVFRELTEAKMRAGAGDKQASIDLYRKIWDDRCLYPLVGAEAQRALKEMGVLVKETPAPPPADPNLTVTKPTTKTRH